MLMGHAGTGVHDEMKYGPGALRETGVKGPPGGSQT